jgi:NitT/TauT family transport system ATP-binding protein
MQTSAQVGLADKAAAAPAALAVEARRLSLVFETSDGKVEALSNVDLQIEVGDFVSFIGGRGAARPLCCA